MKLRDIPQALGFHAKPVEYGYDVQTFALAREGDVRLARWHHPSETPKAVTQESVDALRTFLAPGDVAIDIGAHTGDSTLPIALAVGPEGLVFALEPNPYVFKVLAANATLNPAKTRIVPLMFAAMPEDAEYQFEYSDAGFCNGGFHRGVGRWTHGHFAKLRVAGRNLGRYLREHAADVNQVRYIKIDTEGFDRAVVASLTDLLKSARPFVRTEIYKHLPKDDRTGYYDDLRGLDYRLFRFEHDHQYRGVELGLNDFMRERHFDVFAVPAEKV